MPELLTTVPPGVMVKSQLPAAGNPESSIVAVASVHVGCMILAIVGADGLAGKAFMVAGSDAGEEHPF